MEIAHGSWWSVSARLVRTADQIITKIKVVLYACMHVCVRWHVVKKCKRSTVWYVLCDMGRCMRACMYICSRQVTIMYSHRKHLALD